ncbi:aminocarboxymuconate-semialdehyde decarboxylase [Anoxybacillus vitaminiphilus]|uniref:Aminocarboxymuconate-semialdehyde decarboxylase n=1 Tax=Paranoxybacillus vitaminiphilus TaxID=581036 RepID=A0A327Y415_9BACL|nr:amidohydrolase family protein [Anoxybacillus vitaminiphilus]RAK15052.1 aminocarboxymuconate-semialdehyde decarboxylase [Anoxybacillus vitaminiphilus]
MEDRFDVHTHFIPSEVVQWLKEEQKHVPVHWDDNGKMLTINYKWGFGLKDEFIDPNAYLKAQHQAGVCHSLVSPIPQLFLYDVEATITKELSRLYNDALSRWVSEHSDRLSALATVPLNQPEQAALELRRAMQRGLKGAIIGPSVQQKLLTDESLIPFWEEADTLGAILFIHPLLCDDPRLQRRRMANLIGVPWETTICATDLLLGGWMDRYPRVRILLAHGGGFLPYQIGRLQKGYEVWRPVAASLQAPPTDYLRRFWFDTVLWDDRVLQLLIDLVGDDRVLPGSDFPFDLSHWPPRQINTEVLKSFLTL